MKVVDRCISFNMMNNVVVSMLFAQSLYLRSYPYITPALTWFFLINLQMANLPPPVHMARVTQNGAFVENCPAECGLARILCISHK